MALYQVKAYCRERDDYQEFTVERDTEHQALESARGTLKWLESTQGGDYAVNLCELSRNQSWHVVFENYSLGEEQRISVMAANEADSIYLAKIELRQLVGNSYCDWDCVEAFRGRGGRRPGAGRPADPKAKTKTVVKRIPVALADKLDEIDSLLHLIEDWKERSSNAPETSPRWERARELLSEVSEILGD